MIESSSEDSVDGFLPKLLDDPGEFFLNSNHSALIHARSDTPMADVEPPSGKGKARAVRK